ASSASASPPSDLRLWRSILRRWPKAASVTRCNVRLSHGNGCERGTSSTSEEVTLGGGTNAVGATSKRMRACVRQPASTDRRPYDLEPEPAVMRSATSRWNISTSRSYQGGHGSTVSQVTSSAVAML